MSYETWHTYGYGICTDDISEHSVFRLQALLGLAPEIHAKIQTWLSDEGVVDPTWDDYTNYDEDYQLGLAAILKNVIFEVEGIELTACDDIECRKYLVYQPLYPWCMSDTDKTVTAQSLRQLFDRYVRVLTDKPVEVDYQSVENGG